MAFQMRSLSVPAVRHKAIPRRPKGSQRRGCGRTRAASPRPLPYPSTTASTPLNAEPDTRFSNVFSQVETMIIDTFNSTQPGSRLDWEEVEGCFVLRPPASSPPEAVAVFLGGAFVGASPHIAYRLFLETLCNRNVMVVAAPYSTGFDQIRIADEAQFKFDRCLKELGVEVRDLPVYGVGHSMGALLHMIINTRYTVPRAGNAMLSFNNRAAIDVIPFLSPVIEPSAKMLGPVLSQMSASPLGTSVEGMAQAMKGLSPSVVRQLTPLLEQLSPMYMDVSQGRSEFTPSPEEARNLIRTYYGVSKNLLVRFTNDTIDETNELAAMLQGTSAVSRLLDLTIRTLPGGHMRPLTQNFVDLPPEVARLANSAVYGSGEVIGRMAEMANEMGVVVAEQPLRDLGKGVQSMASVFGGNVGGPVTDHVQDLADELAMWMGVTSVAARGVRTLPPSNPEPPLLQPQLG